MLTRERSVKNWCTPFLKSQINLKTSPILWLPRWRVIFRSWSEWITIWVQLIWITVSRKLKLLLLRLLWFRCNHLHCTDVLFWAATIFLMLSFSLIEATCGIFSGRCVKWFFLSLWPEWIWYSCPLLPSSVSSSKTTKAAKTRVFFAKKLCCYLPNWRV